jgi:hypothetical protein
MHSKPTIAPPFRPDPAPFPHGVLEMKFSSGWSSRSVGGPVSPWVDGFLIHANKGQKGSIPGSAARKVSPSKLQIRNGRSPTQSAKAKVPESDSSNSSMKSRLVEMEETGGFSEVCWEALEVPRRPKDKEYFCPFLPSTVDIPRSRTYPSFVSG